MARASTLGAVNSSGLAVDQDQDQDQLQHRSDGVASVGGKASDYHAAKTVRGAALRGCLEARGAAQAKRHTDRQTNWSDTAAPTEAISVMKSSWVREKATPSRGLRGASVVRGQGGKDAPRQALES